MKNLVIKAIKDFSLLENVNHISVAVSGGADSVALLHILNEIKDDYGYTLSALHFNHLIRGEEAQRDALFAEKLCKRLNIPFILGTGDVPEYAHKKGISLELAAREMRYSFFEKQNKCVVATAHTASDNLETVIFNLTRGTALQGLCGIPAKRDIYIRPLIYCTRADIENYCKQNNLDYVTDSTNLLDECSRNKIRHNVIPVLKQINPSVESSVLNTCKIVGETLADIKSVANNYICENICEDGLKLSGFNKLSITVKKQIVVDFLSLHKGVINLSNCHIDAIMGIVENGGYSDIPGAFTVYSNKQILSVINSKLLDENTELFSVFLEKTTNVNNLFLNDSLDCGKIVGNLKVRTRLPADKIRLFNKQHTKTLKQLFNENKVPDYLRQHLPVIADDKGVVWVYSFGVDKRCCIDKNTTEIIKIKTQKH